MLPKQRRGNHQKCIDYCSLGREARRRSCSGSSQLIEQHFARVCGIFKDFRRVFFLIAFNKIREHHRSGVEPARMKAMFARCPPCPVPASSGGLGVKSPLLFLNASKHGSHRCLPLSYSPVPVGLNRLMSQGVMFRLRLLPALLAHSMRVGSHQTRSLRTRWYTLASLSANTGQSDHEESQLNVLIGSVRPKGGLIALRNDRPRFLLH